MAEPVAPESPDEVQGRRDVARWAANAVVEKWATEEDWRAGQPPDEVVESDGNMLVNVGINRIMGLLIGASTVPYDNARARVGVGNGTTAEAATQTDLAAGPGTGNRFFKRVNAGYPRLEDAVGNADAAGTFAAFQSTFFDAEGNFRWNEWVIDNGTADGTVVTAPMLNRKVPKAADGTTPRPLGEKFGGVWTLTVTVTLR